MFGVKSDICRQHRTCEQPFSGDCVSSSRYPVKLASVLIAVVITLVGIGLDRLLAVEGVSRVDIRVLSNALIGLVAGAFLYVYSRKEEKIRALLQSRMAIVAEMNHHIRNALQVICYYAYRESDQRVVQMIRDSVNRIDWALREVLPNFAGVGEPKVPVAATDGPQSKRESKAAS